MSINRPKGYHSSIKNLFSQISADGHCLGNSFMTMQAMLALDLATFTQRIEHIYYGIPHPTQAKKRITLDDLNDLILVEKLDIEEEKENKEIKENKNDKSVEDKAKTEQKINKMNDEFKLLKEKLNQFTSTTDMKEIVSVKPKTLLGSFYDDVPLMQPDILKKQIHLAWQIRKAYIKKIRQEILTSQHAGLSQDEIVKKKLEQFDQKYPFLWTLIEIEIFFSDIVFYQNIQDLLYMLPEEFHSSTQQPELVMPLLSPSALDQKSVPAIECVDSLTHLYSYQEMKKFFDSLAQTFEKNNISNNIPFSMILIANGHAIAMGFNAKNKSWYLVDINNPYPKEVDQSHIALEAFSSLTSLDTFNYVLNDNIQTVLKYYGNENKFVYVETFLINDAKEISVQDDKLTKALAESKELLKIQDLKFNISMRIYTTSAAKKEIAAIFSDWRDASEFKALHSINASLLAATSDIRKSQLFLYACGKDDVFTTRQLIEYGVDVNQAIDIWLPLVFAAHVGAKDVVKLLIEKKADINKALQQNDQTALFSAVYMNQAQSIELLIQAGAKRGISNELIMSNIFSINYHYYYKKWNIYNKLSEKGVFLLLMAIEKNHKSAVNILIRHGADLQSALYLAAGFGLTKIVEKLLNEYQVDPNFIHPDAKKSPLDFAFDEKTDEVIKILVAAKADFKLCAQNTILHRAALISTAMVELVVKGGVRLHQINEKKETAIEHILKLYLPNKDVVRLLLKLGETSDLLQHDEIEKSMLYSNNLSVYIKDVLREFHAEQMKRMKMGRFGLFSTVDEEERVPFYVVKARCV